MWHLDACSCVLYDKHHGRRPNHLVHSPSTCYHIINPDLSDRQPNTPQVHSQIRHRRCLHGTHHCGTATHRRVPKIIPKQSMIVLCLTQVRRGHMLSQHPSCLNWRCTDASGLTLLRHCLGIHQHLASMEWSWGPKRVHSSRAMPAGAEHTVAEDWWRQDPTIDGSHSSDAATAPINILMDTSAVRICWFVVLPCP